MAIELGKIGIWRPVSGLTGELAAEVEGLGYGSIWIGGSPDGELKIVDTLLAATERVAVATSIVNMWKDDADTVAASFHRINERFPNRFLLGVGIGHPEATKEYRKPYDTMVDYLDRLDAAGVPKDSMTLAALGPRVLRLAADRTAGAHPYLTTPQHTREARELMGPGALLAPEQKVVVDTDPERARSIGRPAVKTPYLGLTNYVSNLRRLGWTDEDLAEGGSDRLIDALALHGDARTIAAGVTAHLDAGADHVAVQVLGPDPLPGFRALAEVLPVTR
ncbi:MAG TPA: LLM class F420-dependent oxidoreductase [Pseudonocardiaceae bacterium]|jgi:probable F420-dependent oxidoreductase|nr:LLM class F420-dependent oxidoreductase [Pseudonocardiaceae bacterium]